jgi:hypothetical protein
MNKIKAFLIFLSLLVISILQYFKIIKTQQEKEKESIEKTGNLVDCPTCTILTHEDCAFCNGFGRLEKNTEGVLSICSTEFIKGYYAAQNGEPGENSPYFLKFRADRWKRGWSEGNKTTVAIK